MVYAEVLGARSWFVARTLYADSSLYRLPSASERPGNTDFDDFSRLE